MIWTGTFGAGRNVNAQPFYSCQSIRRYATDPTGPFLPEIGRTASANWAVRRDFPRRIFCFPAAHAWLVDLTLSANRFLIGSEQLGVVSTFRTHAPFKLTRIAGCAIAVIFINAMRHGHFPTTLVAMRSSHAPAHLPATPTLRCNRAHMRITTCRERGLGISLFPFLIREICLLVSS